jgi:hypothetical protein
LTGEKKKRDVKSEEKAGSHTDRGSSEEHEEFSDGGPAEGLYPRFK